MNSVVMEGFHYPENPDWSVQEDEIQGMVDRFNGAKRIWPILSILRAFVPLFRDILCGFIDEGEGQPAAWSRQRWKSFGAAKPGLPSWRWLSATILPLIYIRKWGSRNLRSLMNISFAKKVLFFRSRSPLATGFKL
jgi:hypothetical protein